MTRKQMRELEDLEAEAAEQRYVQEASAYNNSKRRSLPLFSAGYTFRFKNRTWEIVRPSPVPGQTWYSVMVIETNDETLWPMGSYYAFPENELIAFQNVKLGDRFNYEDMVWEVNVGHPIFDNYWQAEVSHSDYDEDYGKSDLFTSDFINENKVA